MRATFGPFWECEIHLIFWNHTPTLRITPELGLGGPGNVEKLLLRCASHEGHFWTLLGMRNSPNIMSTFVEVRASFLDNFRIVNLCEYHAIQFSPEGVFQVIIKRSSVYDATAV